MWYCFATPDWHRLEECVPSCSRTQVPRLYIQGLKERCRPGLALMGIYGGDIIKGGGDMYWGKDSYQVVQLQLT